MKVFKFKIYKTDKWFMIGKVMGEFAIQANSQEEANDLVEDIICSITHNGNYYRADEDGVILNLLTVQEAKELNEEAKEN